jgi:hypothetical protein
MVDQHWYPLFSDDQLQLCRGESREGSGRDGIMPLMLQRDYTVSMRTI